jgi:hypothetical protein
MQVRDNNTIASAVGFCQQHQIWKYQQNINFPQQVWNIWQQSLIDRAWKVRRQKHPPASLRQHNPRDGFARCTHAGARRAESQRGHLRGTKAGLGKQSTT